MEEATQRNAALVEATICASQSMKEQVQVLTNQMDTFTVLPTKKHDRPLDNQPSVPRDMRSFGTRRDKRFSVEQLKNRDRAQLTW